MRLRVLTLNVQNTEGSPRRQELLRDVVTACDADLVSLQEVDSPDHLEMLVSGTDLHPTHQSDVVAEQPPFTDSYGGTGLATRWPHRIVEALDQRALDAPDVPWVTLAAAVDVPDLAELLFVATTSSWRLDAEAQRERQALALADLDARHRRDLPTIIAGDLNADPDAASIRFLTGRQSLSGRSVHYHDGWAVAGHGPGHTWTTDNGAAAEEIGAIVRQPQHHRRMDYILIGSWHAHPHARAEVRSITRVGTDPSHDVWPSDHFGVLAELEVTIDD